MNSDQPNKSLVYTSSDWTAPRLPEDTSLLIIPPSDITKPHLHSYFKCSLCPQVAVFITAGHLPCIAPSAEDCYECQRCPGEFTNTSAAQSESYSPGYELYWQRSHPVSSSCCKACDAHAIDVLSAERTEVFELSHFIDSPISCAQYEVEPPYLQPNIAPQVFQCMYSGCGKIFKRQKNLSRHSLCHSGIRPHVCWVPGCNHRFLRRDNLNSHYLTHGRHGGRNRYVATLDKQSSLYDPTFCGQLTPQGWPVGTWSDT